MHPVIRNIAIKNFRGFRDFRLEGLTDLTILTGRNGCGKSSLLDALLVGAAPNFLAAIGDVVQRHPVSKDSARWLFNDTSLPADIRLGTQDGSFWRRLRYFAGLRTEVSREGQELVQIGSSKPFRTISAFEVGLHAGSSNEIQQDRGHVVFDLNGQFRSRRTERARASVNAATIIDPSVFRELSKSFSKAVQQGFRGRLRDFLRGVLPGLESIQILTEDDDSSNVYLEWPHGAVPLSLSGDGIAAMLQIAIEAVVVDKGGLILVEEPEVFLHPRAISVVASLLLELMKEGRQVVITTHSLELIDSLLGWSAAEDRDQMSLFNLRPADGGPQVVRWSGSKMDFVRSQVMDDLR